MMKRHFEEFAQYIWQCGPDSLVTRRAMADMVIYVASHYNPRFDRARFLRACGLG